MTESNQGHVSLRDYVDLRISQLERHIDTQFTAVRQAVDKAEGQVDERLALLNEFRAQSADQAKKYALRETVDATTGSLFEKLAVIASDLSNLQGRAFALSGGGAVVGAVTTAIVIKLLSAG